MESYKSKFQEAKTVDSIDLVFDHSDFSDEAERELKSKLKKIGVYVYNHPATKDSDMYGFIISKKPLSRKDLNSYIMDES
jgi:hypothetical protein